MGAAKRRANVTISGDLLDAARAERLNVSAIAEAALAQAVAETRRATWRRENAEALAERREWLDRHGLPLAKWTVGPKG